jgi:hypothetical protein
MKDSRIAEKYLAQPAFPARDAGVSRLKLSRSGAMLLRSR